MTPPAPAVPRFAWLLLAIVALAWIAPPYRVEPLAGRAFLIANRWTGAVVVCHASDSTRGTRCHSAGAPR